MATKWIKVGRGIRYREHATRKHGTKLDRYYTIYYSIKGKDYSEGIGWSSDGTRQETCEKILMTLRSNHKSGVGAQTYKDLREENLAQQEEIKEQKRKDDELTLRHIFENGYLQQQKNNGKKEETIKNEIGFFNHYIDDFFGKTSIKKIDVKLIDKFLYYLNGLTSKATSKPLSDSTKRNILALISQLFTYSQTRIDSTLQNPIRLVKKPRSDNSRERFLQVDEANKLLDELKTRSISTYQISFISLFTGMRAGEILKLSWNDVNFQEKSIFIKDPKNKSNRHAYMVDEVEELLKEMYEERKNDKIFSANEISRTFDRVIEILEFNKGVDDPRQKVCFHTLRHTFASWHAKAGTPLFTISKLLGHKSIKMTERYSHLCPTAEKQAVQALKGALNPQKAKTIQFDRVKEG